MGEGDLQKIFSSVELRPYFIQRLTLFRMSFGYSTYTSMSKINLIVMFWPSEIPYVEYKWIKKPKTP